MNRYKLIVAYDGTDFQGWQVQPNKRAIANVLRDVFQDVFHIPVQLVGASRTDAGVHALGQVARISTDLSIAPELLRAAWNNRLPPTILIRSCQQVDASFHPQAQVQQKTYWYHFFIQRPLPFVQRYGYFMRYPVDMQKLQEALQFFVGTHDFRSFCTGDEHGSTVGTGSTIRTIDSIDLQYVNRFGVYRIEVKGERFLRYMIRRMVGAALAVASRSTYSIALLQSVMEVKNPEHVLPTAPAKGLLLRKIVYKQSNNTQLI